MEPLLPFNAINPLRKYLMPLPANSQFAFTSDLRICRVLNGLWQVSGAHGPIPREAAIQNMFDYFDAGFTTFDLADHYGPAEDFIGEFRRRLVTTRGTQALANLQAFTKWVPPPTRILKRMVEDAVNTSRRHMHTESLDLLQFHWWDYDHPAYLDALEYLSQLRDAGLIKHLALTNFDTAHLRLIVERGIAIVSNQVQFSLIDRRPAAQMIPFCQAHGLTLLAYGTLCGGLLSERYLGKPEPHTAVLNTASLRKYKQMIDAWGGWMLFQELLRALKEIADKHQVSIANVAVRYILDRPAVAGVIIGARLGVSDHRAENARVFDVALDADDEARLNAVLAQARDLMKVIGDCGEEYRR